MLLEMTRPVQGGLRQERKLEAVSNNLANADTNAFKKDRISFDDKFKAQVNKDFSQGMIQTTGNPFDLALVGQGFFKVETPDGIRYTRNGNFTVDANGGMVDQKGYPGVGQGGAVAMGAENSELGLSINWTCEIFIIGEIGDTLEKVIFQEIRNMERCGERGLR